MYSIEILQSIVLQVDAVVESEEGSVRSIELMNKTLKPSAVEPLLQRLQQAKWIVCVSINKQACMPHTW